MCKAICSAPERSHVAERGNVAESAARVSHVLASTGLMLSLLLSGELAAADDNDKVSNPPDGLEQVVVTATRRAEDIYKVPESITALSSAELEAMQADSFVDFAGSVPGVEFTSEGPGRTKITMRGLSSSNGVSTIGFYVDDTPVTSRDSNGEGQPEIKLFDVDRVEVLHGPQGTLYGEGALGGAIRIITKQPDATEFAGTVDSALSLTRNGSTNRDFNVMLNVPLLEDQMALRATGYFRGNSGWIDDIVSGLRDVNTEQSKGVRVSLKYLVTDALTLIARFTNDDLHTNAPNINQVGLSRYDTNTGALSPLSDISNLFSLSAIYNFSFAQLTSNSAYYRRDTQTNAAFPPAILAIYDQYLFNPPLAAGTLTSGGLLSADLTKEFTQEVRLVSTSSGPLNWIAGTYYRDGKDPATFALFLKPASVLPPDGYLFNTVTTVDTQHVALFGEAGYEFTNELELRGGARWFRESTSDGQRSVVSDAVTPKVTLSYKFTPNNTAYVTTSTGFRSGGLNTDIGDSRPLSYRPDRSVNYELGDKALLFDGRVGVMAAVYYIDWKDMQIFTTIPTSTVGFTDNAGKAHTAGMEAELDVQPVTGLTFRLTGSYTQAQFDQAFGAVKKGNELESVPKFKGSASADYRFKLSKSLTATLQGDVQYVGASWGSDLNGDFPLGSTLQRSYALANVSTVLAGRKYWQVTLFADNVMNRAAVLENDTFGGLYEYRPRTVGLRARFDF